jgi:hypothetical protein
VVDECGVWRRWERDVRRRWTRENGIAVELRFLDAPVEVLTARVAERNRTVPDGAPRIDPALVAIWNDRIERPDADELALFDRSTERRQGLVNFPQRSGHSCCLLLVADDVLFVLDRWPILQGAVEPVAVVPDEPLEDRGSCLGSGGEVFVVDQFAFQ